MEYQEAMNAYIEFLFLYSYAILLMLPLKVCSDAVGAWQLRTFSSLAILWLVLPIKRVNLLVIK